MPVAARQAGRLYHRVRRALHPWMEHILPVSFLPEEIAERKRQMDPTGARSLSVANPATQARLRRLGSVFSIEPADVDAMIDEALRVKLLPVPPGARLASPMCMEDRIASYLVTRAVLPSVAVETGVAYGVSSAYILSALNGVGRLESIEHSTDPNIGACVPKHVRAGWTLHIGDSLAVLPVLLEQVGSIDLFIHDSWHGYRHMRREYELAWKFLRSGGVLCSHDVLATNAFQRFTRAHRNEIDTWVTSVNFGVIRKQ